MPIRQKAISLADDLAEYVLALLRHWGPLVSGAVIGLITWYYGVRTHESIPTRYYLTLLVGAALVSSFLAWRDNKRADMTRPHIIGQYVFEMRYDEEIGEEYEHGMIEFRNIGNEPALDITIEPVTILDRTISLSNTVPSLTPSEAPVRRDFFVSYVLTQTRRILKMKLKEPINVRLTIKYRSSVTDKHWSTAHRLSLNEYYSVTLAPLDPNSRVAWTNVSASLGSLDND